MQIPTELELEEQAVAIVAKETKTHDEAVARFYRHRNSKAIFNENDNIGKMVEQVILRLKAEAQNAKLIEAAEWLVRNCTAELYSPWDTALKMARAALQQAKERQ